MKIKITAQIEGWLGVKKNKVYDVVEFVECAWNGKNFENFFHVKNENGKIVSVPHWAKKIV